MSLLADKIRGHEQKFNSDDALIQTELTVGRSMKKLRFLILGAFILSLVSLIGAGYLYQSLNAEKRQRAAYEAAQDELSASSTELNDQVSKYKTVITGLRDQISEYTDERKQFKKELERNKIEIENLRKKMLGLEDQKKSLSQEAAEARARAEATAAQLKEAQTADAPAAVVPVVREVSEPAEEELSTDTRDAEAASAPAAVATESETQSQVKAADGTVSAEPSVLSVNRKYSFAVVNLGRKEGIKIGDTFDVFRNNKRIAALEVEKLYDHFVAAKIVKEEGREEIKQGDQVQKTS